MNYFLKKKKWLAWVIMLTFLFTSFMPSNIMAGNSVAEAAISGDSGSETIQVGETTTISNTGLKSGWNDGAQYRISWSSSKENIATVTSPGTSTTVSGKETGTTTITAKEQYWYWRSWTDSGNKKTYTITVEPKEYTVTFDKNGGDGTAPAAMTAERGTVVTLPDQGEMTRNGYTFMGWGPRDTSGQANQSSNGVEAVAIYPAGSEWEITRNQTLYAVWATSADARYFVRLDGEIPTEPGSYSASAYTDDADSMHGTVKYNTFYAKTDGNGVADHLGTVPSTKAIREACNKKVESIKFTDGSSYTTCNTDKAFEDNYYVLWYVIKQDPIHVDGVLLKKNLYNVTYQPNAPVYTGDVPMGTQYAEGKTVTVEGQGTLAREGYTFDGWDYGSVGSGTVYNVGDIFTMPAKNVELYARWIPNNNTKYTVEYWYENDNGDFVKTGAHPDEERYGVTEAQASVTNSDKVSKSDNHYYDANNVYEKLSGTIVADGTLVLKVYFKKKTPLTITALGDTKVYDGNPLTQPVYKVTYEGKDYVATAVEIPSANSSYEVTLDNEDHDIVQASTVGSITDVGTKDNLIAMTSGNEPKVMRDGVDVTNQYKIAIVDGTLTVTKRNVTLTTGSDSKTYDGTPLTKPGVTVSGDGFAAGEGAEYDVIGSQTDVGSSANEFTYTLNEGTKTGNYNITKEEGTLTVTKNEQVITITADSNSKMYDGSALTDTDYSYTQDVLAEGDVLTAVVTGSQEDAGSSANVVTSYVVMRGDKDVTDYYTFGESVDGTLTVTKRNVTLTTGSDSKTYDGTPLTKPGVTVSGDGFAAGEGAEYDVIGSQTDVGSSANEFTYTLNEGTKTGNYNITKEEGTLTVTKNEQVITITADSNSKMYDGSALTDTDYSYTQDVLAEGDVLTAVVTGSQEDAGSSANVVTSYVVMRGDKDVTDYYTFGESVDGTLTVTKRNVTLTTGSDSKTYDGTPLTKPGVTVSGDGFAAGEGAEYDVIGSQTDVGSSANEFTYTLNEGTKTGNYNITKEEGTLTVTKNEQVITITADSNSKMYDGSALTDTDYSYTQDVLAEGDVLTAVVTGSQEDAGSSANVVTSYVVMRGDKDVTDYYTFGESVDGTLTVTKRNVTLTTGSDSKTYDGTPLTKPGVTVSGDGFAAGEGAEYDVIGSQTDVGSSANEFTYTLNEGTKTGNYNITKEEGTLTVTKNEQVITITADSNSKMYDGSALTDTDYSYTQDVLAEGDVLTAVVTGSQEDAGSSANVVTSYVVMRGDKDVTDYYTFGESVDGTLTVTKRNVTLTTGSDSKTYDGTPLTKPGVTVSGDGFAAGEGAEYDVIGSQTDVGSSANEFTYTLNEGTKTDNYNITKEEGTLTVTKNEQVITITADSNSKMYDGSALTDTDYSYTQDVLAEGDVLTAVVTGSQEDAGSSANVVTSYVVMRGDKDVTDYYTFGESVDGTLTVTKRNVTLTTGSDSKTYDGTPLTKPGVTVSGDGFAAGEGAEYDVIGSQTDVGSSANEFTYTLNEGTKTDNYNITKEEGTLTVTKNEQVITITADSNSKMYDGSALTDTDYSYTQDVLAEGDVLTAVVTGSQEDAGSSANVVTSYVVMRGDKDVTDYYTFGESVDGTLTVTKRNVTLTTGSDSKTYDGTPLTKPGVTVSGDGFAAGEGAEYDVIGSQTDVGSSANEFTYTLNEGTKTGNYNITKEEGTLTVTKNEQVITITADSNSKMYDGSALTDTDYSYTQDVLAEGDVLTAVVTGSQEDAGSSANVVTSYVVMRGDKDVTDYYTFGESVDGTLTVTKRNVTLTTGSDSKTYDGTPLTKPGVTVSGDGFAAGEGAEYDVIGSQTDVGSSANEFTYTLNEGTKTGNYNITKEEGTLTVTKNEQVITITADSNSKMYDGSALTDTDYSYTQDVLAEGDVLTAVVTGSQEDAGSSANVVTSYVVMRGDKDVTDYYTFGESVDGTLTVTKRNVTLTTGSDSKTYDGTPLTKPGVTVSGDGFAAGEGAEYDVIGSQTDVGSSANEFTYTLNEGTKTGNYNITKEEGTLTVTKNEQVITITADSNSKMYDGSALTDTDYSYTQDVLAEGDVLTAVVTGSQEDAGSSANVVTSYVVMRGDKDVTDYYTFGESVDGTLTVTPREVTITVDNASKIVGTEDPTFTGTVEGLVSESDLGEITYSRTNYDEVVGTYEGVLTANYTPNSNYDVTVIPGDFTITQNEGTKYTVQYWYQDPKTGDYTINGGTRSDVTTSGAIAFITEEDTVTTRSMYQFNAEKTDVQKMVKADGSTVLNVYFDALYNVVYNVVDENGNVKREVARSGYVYRYNDLVKAPGVVNDELNKFDGKWYKDTAVTDEWSFKDTIEAAISAGLIISENNTMILYTKADVTPLTANTLRIEKQTVNAPNANTDYKFNLKLLAKVDTVTAPVEGEAAQKMHELSSAKITAEGKRDAAWNEVLGATDKFKNSAMVTTNSSLSFIMYGDKVEDINGDEINPALFSLGTTGSAYQFRSYNLFEDSFAVEPAEYASVDDDTLDWMVEIISNLANPYLRTPFQTLDPESVLTEMQVAGVNTSGSALAFGFDQASDLYLAAQDYFEKEKVFKAAEFELETYLVELNRRAVITVNGNQYILDAVDENGNALFEKDADGNYILNFDFTLKSGTFQDFKVEATTGSSIQFIVTETYDGGADSTTVNDVTTHSAYGFLTAEGNTIAFVNTFEDDGPVDPWDPWEPTDPTDPTDPDIEIEDPDVPLTDPEEPVIEIEDPDVPLVDVPGEEVEIDEPEVPLGDAPQTGDNSNTIPFVVLMLAAACGLVVTRRKLN